VLAAWAPDLHQALQRTRDDGLPRVTLDGKIIPCGRRREKIISVKGQVIDLSHSGRCTPTAATSRRCSPPPGFPCGYQAQNRGLRRDRPRRGLRPARPRLKSGLALGVIAGHQPGHPALRDPVSPGHLPLRAALHHRRDHQARLRHRPTLAAQVFLRLATPHSYVLSQDTAVPPPSRLVRGNSQSCSGPLSG
jgi:hypothetical protein